MATPRIPAAGPSPPHQGEGTIPRNGNTEARSKRAPKSPCSVIPRTWGPGCKLLLIPSTLRSGASPMVVHFYHTQAPQSQEVTLEGGPRGLHAADVSTVTHWRSLSEVDFSILLDPKYTELQLSASHSRNEPMHPFVLHAKMCNTLNHQEK
ncbi:hypothetical protein H920_04670 [Fukomys damarensis]|uniref:Uncharacterized protein n=1 Tax=Fukomys damarensis TaxID=885580 RepID=A0A091DUE4_FUKDA|nr:hypothetical protein H920_04670 [Fukomys damarensis]